MMTTPIDDEVLAEAGMCNHTEDLSADLAKLKQIRIDGMFKNYREIEMTVKVDTNDADYITETTKISSDDLRKIMPLINAIKEFEPYPGKSKKDYMKEPSTFHHNYPNGEYSPREDMGEKTIQEIYESYGFDEELFEIFEEFCPYGEYGFHSIEKIELCPSAEKLRIL